MNDSRAVEIEKRRYLFGVLQMNPANQADKIISARRRWYGEEVEELVADVDPNHTAKLRQNIADRIEEVRAQFWTQSAPHLKSRLDGLPVAKFPDLKSAAERLKLLLVYRDEINGLSQESKVNINLLNNFKRVVMSSPREAGKIKERYLRSFRDHRPGTSGPGRKAMVKMLRSKHPNLYQLESAWFDEILRARISKPVVEEYQYDDFGGGGFEIPGWVIYVFVIVVIRVLIMVARLGG